MSSSVLDAPPPPILTAPVPTKQLPLIHSSVAQEVQRFDSEALATDDSVQATFIDQHFSGGSLAAMEAHRLRQDLVGLLQLIAAKKRQSVNNGASVAEDSGVAQRQEASRDKHFFDQLKVFESELNLTIKETTRALAARVDKQ